MTTQAKALESLINEYITDPDEKEVMLYVQSAQWFALATESCVVNRITSVPDISPEALGLYRRYTAGTTTNSFFHKHFATITAATVMMDINAKTLYVAAKFGNETDASNTVLRDQIANRYAALTTVVFLAKGYEKACAFDLKLKTIMRATDKELEMWK